MEQFPVAKLSEWMVDDDGTDWFLVEWEPTWLPGDLISEESLQDSGEHGMPSRLEKMKSDLWAAATETPPATHCGMAGAVALPCDASTIDGRSAQNSCAMLMAPPAPPTMHQGMGQWLFFKDPSPGVQEFSSQKLHRNFCMAIDDISWMHGISYTRVDATSTGITQADLAKRMNIQLLTSKKKHESGSANVKINISDPAWFEWVRTALLACEWFSELDRPAFEEGPQAKRHRSE